MPKIMFNGVEYAGSGGGGGGSTWITDIPEMHRNIFRGQSLGSSVTSDQLAAIEDGSFDDIYVGDYWTIPVTISGAQTDVNWRVADLDHYLGRGAAWQITDHHLVIMPDEPLYSIALGSTDYYGIRSTILTDAKTMVAEAFPNMTLSYSEYFTSSGSATTADSEVELPDTISITGTANSRKSDTDGTVITVSNQQFALFRLSPKHINSAATYWTRNIYRVNNVVCVTIDHSGVEGAQNVSTVLGIRPYFLIGVQNE